MSNANLWNNMDCGFKEKWREIVNNLQTDEIYYINKRNSMKAKEDPITIENYYYYSETDISNDNEESSSKSESESSIPPPPPSCFMVPKQVQQCPKCCGQLLHFDPSPNGFL
ncbi:protein CURLY FLAG LEAF 1-like [Humulus lupulus]|uniref:protein CURLY FLAG LEAF 1-like n=1 Tax=Humulus lupulus TaxID=3486 RepID=UPI002B400F99|nr:protein CURLY FLAG LEAF 1-like [Humulus lupulus]